MMVLLLRFDAPLISFGAPMVDQNGVVQRFPGRSMLTGLFANALGWQHRDFEELGALQDRIHYAARVDREGEALLDYQTVDLGLPWLDPEKAGWTTRGRIAERSGASSEQTHIRYRHYQADSVHTVAVTLSIGEGPSLEALGEALRFPARPLFLGRKSCLPSGPLFLGLVEAQSPLAALVDHPRAARSDSGRLATSWFEGDAATPDANEHRVVATSDERDWRSQVHVGRRLMCEGSVNPPEATHG